MLDDDAGDLAGCRLECLDAFPRRIRVGDVVVRQLLALQLQVTGDRTGNRFGFTVERGALVWVLAIAQIFDLVEGELQPRREIAPLVVCVETGQVVGDCAVVAGRVSERFSCQVEARAIGKRAVRLQFSQHRRIVGWVGNDAYAPLLVAVVLGSGAHHGRTTDVDVLDRFVERTVRLGDGLAERVEIDDQKIDAIDADSSDRIEVRGQVAPRQQAPVYLGVQSLDPTVEHLGESGVVGYLGHRKTGFAQQFGRATGGQELDA